MCGIVGKVSKEPVAAPLIQSMMDAVRHRGPDDEGMILRRTSSLSIGLGHLRLSVIDPTSVGRQPMQAAGEDIWISYNGEIYNYLELRKVLVDRGHAFKTQTDTEVILNAYREWGAGCIERLEGMFALSVWDESTETLLLARDRVGIKPLLYRSSATGIAFASDLRALLRDPETSRAIDSEALHAYLSLGFIPAPRTIVEDVCKLPPGHYLVWKRGKATLTRYWQYTPQSQYEAMSEEAAIDHVSDALQDAVRRQLVSDVPLGSFLSGGIDSSLVVQSVTKATPNPKAFCAAITDLDWDESPFAREVADQLGVDLDCFEVSLGEQPGLDTIVDYMDEPLADTSLIPTYMLCRETRSSVTVALSGDGGDELFAGYTRYVGERLARFARFVPGPLRRMIGTFGLPADGHATLDRGLRVLETAGVSFVERYLEKSSIVPGHVRSTLFDPAFFDGLGQAWRADIEQKAEATRDLHFVDRLTALDLEVYLPDDMLMKVDRMSMASALEVRVPFLDERMLEAANVLSPNLKLRGLTPKYVLRQLANRHFGRDISRKPKQGFGLPPGFWRSAVPGGSIRDVLLDRTALQRGYFRETSIRSMIEKNGAGNDRALFALVCLELWLQTVLGQTNKL